MSSLELKVSPLPLAIAMGAVMWAIDLWLPLQNGQQTLHFSELTLTTRDRAYATLNS
jgi:hypothetical protein